MKCYIIRDSEAIRRKTVPVRTLFTIGHSNHSLSTLVQLLKLHQISGLVDVRTVPQSRFNPQFGAARLSVELPAENILYAHLKDLGGLRKPLPDSPNTALKNPSFRGYADHMRTERFVVALTMLLERAGSERLAVMCAEAAYTSCHRWLLADAILLKGTRVLHILPSGAADEHRLNPACRPTDDGPSYPGSPPDADRQLSLFDPK
jgi:uncharacterized protein (DUF488 family)